MGVASTLRLASRDLARHAAALTLAATAMLAQAAGWTVGGGSTLAVVGTVGGDVLVAGGGTLAGTGNVVGNVDVANAGTLAPGSPVGTLAVSGNLSLADASVLDYGLGTASDRFQVGGNLTLDGVVNVTALAGFGAGSYRLIDYSGGLINHVLTIGSLPAGHVAGVDAGTSGQVNLIISVTNSSPANFTFIDQTGVPLSTQITSAPVQITGINTTTNWTVGGGQACASSGNGCTCDVAAWGVSGSISNNQYLCARHTSPANFSTATHTVVTVGGVTDTFSSATQPPVTTYSGFTGSGMTTATLVGGGNCGFISAQFIPLSAVPTPPPAHLDFPQGLFEFTLGGGCTPGGTVTLTVAYPQALPAGTQYWKYGPTPDDATPHWYVLPATIAGNTAIFSITDGGLGDDDLTVNGTIVDQGGPGASVMRAIPAMSGWGLFLLSLVLGAVGLGWRHRS